ncbi:MAG: 3-dehydroquinate synthase [Candidatus Caldatribacteriaceae bacterium]
MRIIGVSLPEGRSYPIWIGESLFGEREWFQPNLFSSQRGVCITNTTVENLHFDTVYSFFVQENFSLGKVVIPDGEEYKNLSTVEKIYHQLLKMDLDRKSFLIALGGGVITDVTGFVASTFLRGIDYFQIPTSLLAQVDSSIGGKTGVNMEEGKNLIGTFYQPKGVFINLSFLNTLPEREYREGLGEIVKAAFLAGGEFLASLEKEKKALRERDEWILEKMVGEAVDFKRKIVEKDEKEVGIRSILNYGHTIGHALEKTVGYGKIRHGEAVAIGMVGEALLAWKLGISTEKVFRKQKSILQELGLPVNLDCSLDRSVCLSAMCRDKKREEGKFRFVFLEDFGRPIWGVEVEEKEVLHVLSLLERGA